MAGSHQTSLGRNRDLDDDRPAGVQILTGFAADHVKTSEGTARTLLAKRIAAGSISIRDGQRSPLSQRTRSDLGEHWPDRGSLHRTSRASDSDLIPPTPGARGDLSPGLGSPLARLRGRRISATVETIRAYSNLLTRALSPKTPAEVMIWSDEFDYEGLPDPTKWSYQTEANNWTSLPENAELQWYTADRARNTYVSNGTLKITAHHESYNDCNYTSARLITRYKGDWLYGRIEVCAKLPAARRGVWPAIWMLPTDQKYGKWPNSGELDLMENVGHTEGVVRSSIHTERHNHRNKLHAVGSATRKQAHTRFHVYSMEWSPSKICMFVDRECTLTYTRKDGKVSEPSTWPFDQPFYLVLNVAVGGHWAGRHGIDDSMFPTSLEVAFVRVYQNPHQRRWEPSDTPHRGDRV